MEDERGVDQGPRYSRRVVVLGRQVEVATGYDARADRWPMHAYLVRSDGKLDKLQDVAGSADTLDEALLEAERSAREAVQLRYGQWNGIGDF